MSRSSLLFCFSIPGTFSSSSIHSFIRVSCMQQPLNSECTTLNLYYMTVQTFPSLRIGLRETSFAEARRINFPAS